MRRATVLILTGLFCSVWLVAGAEDPSTAQEAAEADELVLKTAGVGTDPDALLKFFRKRILKDEDRARLEDLIKQLDSSNYQQRSLATRELFSFGRPALPFLKEVLNHSSLETVKRAESLISKIERLSGPEVPVAAARLLAQRRPKEAAETLLSFLPSADDDWVLEETLTSLGRLTVHSGHVEPQLTAALKSPQPIRRQAAAYVLARHGDLATRDLVRQLLADSDPLVRERAAAGLVSKQALQNLRETIASDSATVQSHKVGAEETALLDFLRKRTLSEDDQNRIKALIRQFGAGSYKARQEASRKIVEYGPPALNLLKEAEANPDTEISRRADLCLKEIKRGPGPALSSAVVRLLARAPASTGHSPAAVIRVLLGYGPFVEDELVTEEVITVLANLSVREVKIDPLLPAALDDPLPARRAAAAVVLGKVGTKEHGLAIRRLLDDPTPEVRFRAAQGLIAAKDKAAVPKLIALLTEAPNSAVWKVEELLHQLAGERGPAEPVGEGTVEARQRAAKAWETWWQAQESSFDLTRVANGETRLGLTTICEYDSAVGQPGGQVWECGRDGKPRWKITGLLGAMDAQVLPNGRVLIAENSAQRVTERDLTGAIKWEFRVPNGNPIGVQRLPNGNTFIATYQNVMEVSPTNKVIYDRRPGPQFYVFSARKQKNGHVLAMSAQGMLLEFDPVSGKEIRTLAIGPSGGWCSAEALPNGRFLVATMINGQVREIDAANKTYWTVTVAGAFRATRLPNGNTLVASMQSRKVTEFDRAGTVRWEKTCDGRPWSVRYR